MTILLSFSRPAAKILKVHSSATINSWKMEIPENAWTRDPYGMALANHINSHLLIASKFLAFYVLKGETLSLFSFL